MRWNTPLRFSNNKCKKDSQLEVIFQDNNQMKKYHTLMTLKILTKFYFI